MNLRKTSRIAAFALGGSLVAAACGGTAATTESATPATDAAPAAGDESAASTFPQFIAPIVGGGQLEFGSLEGQDTVLWFWAPW